MSLRTFLPYLFARILISLQTTMLSVMIGWHLYRLTGDPFDLALIGIALITPQLGLFIFAGWVADHFPRKLTIIASTATQAMMMVLLAALMRDLQSPDFNQQLIYVLVFFYGCAFAFYGPSLQAIFPNIVGKDQFARAVSISTTSWNIAFTVGPIIAGLLLAAIDQHSYSVLALFSAGASLLYCLLPNKLQAESKGGDRSDLLGGLRYVMRNQIVLGCVSLDLFIVLTGSVMVLLPIYAMDILEVGPEGLGFLRAMPAIGAVVVGVGMSLLPPMKHTGRTLFIALFIFALSVLLFAFSAVFWLSLFALFIYGASDMVSVNIRNTLIQLNTPDSLRGRVSSVSSVFVSMSNQLGDFRAGAVAALIGTGATVFAGGCMALVVAIGGSVLFPKLRALGDINSTDNSSERSDQ